MPAYFHPSVAPREWRRLTALAPALRLVVVNVHNGPGAAPDPCYLPVIDGLRAAGIRLVGYVDTDYGRRRVVDVAREVSAFVRWYHLDGVFLDQVSAELADLDRYSDLVLAARVSGAAFVALNPGTHPHPGYVDLANVTVTFEGSWRDYRSLSLPAWVHGWPASRFCHLVHSVPPRAFDRALEAASRRHVRSVFLTDGHGANPWDHLPTALVRSVAGSTPAAAAP